MRTSTSSTIGTSSGRSRRGSRRIADSWSCTTSEGPRSTQARGTASRRRWGSTRRNRSGPSPGRSTRRRSERLAMRGLKIAGQGSYESPLSPATMRAAIPLVLVALLLAPAQFAFAHEAPAGGEPPRDSRPHLMPPQPGAQVWPSATRQGDPILPPGPTQTTGTVRILVLLVRFTDVPATQTPAFVDGVFNDASPGAKSMHAYYSEVSIGTLTIQATVIAMWFQSVHPMSDYDGVVDHITIVHAGAGQEGGGSSDLIWSHRWAVLDADPTVPGSQSLMADGVQIYGYTMVGEDSPVGVVAHEFGHDLGLPDLYDTDGSSDGAGIWDIMAGGSWNGAPAGTSPADMTAWSRIRLGWITPTEVTTALIGTSVPQAETLGGKVFRLSIPGASSPEYFLIENRESVGFDAALPASGLLVWHVDDAVSPNDG